MIGQYLILDEALVKGGRIRFGRILRGSDRQFWILRVASQALHEHVELLLDILMSLSEGALNALLIVNAAAK